MKLPAVILTAAALCAGAAAFALSPEDKNALAAAEKSLASYSAAPFPQAAFPQLVIREVLTASPQPATFEQLAAAVTAAAEKTAFESDDRRQALYDRAVVSASLWRFGGKFVAGGYQYAKGHGISDPYFCLHAQKIGLSEAEELAYFVELFERASKGDLWIFKSRHERFNRLLNHVPEAEAKAILKRLNRAYSPKLVTDKAAYEPVVAMIRTMLETY